MAAGTYNRTFLDQQRRNAAKRLQDALAPHLEGSYTERRSRARSLFSQSLLGGEREQLLDVTASIEDIVTRFVADLFAARGRWRGHSCSYIDWGSGGTA